MRISAGAVARFCAYAGALLLLGLRDAVESAPVGLLVGLLVAAGLFLLVVTITESAKSTYYLITVPTLLMTAFFIHYCLGAVIIIIWDSLPWTTALNRAVYEIHSVRSYIGVASYLALIAGLGLSAGSAICIRLPIAKHHTDESDVAQLRRVAPAMLMACTLVALFVTPKLSAEWQQLVHVFAYFSSLLIAIAAYVAATCRRRVDRQRWQVICLLGCALYAVQGMSNGAREEFIKPVIFAAVGWIAARRRIPWVPALLALLIFIFVALPILNAVKDRITYHGSDGGIAGFVEARTEVASSGYALAIENVTSNLLQRLTLVSYPALYSQFYPHVFPWLDGETFLLEAEELIPRAVWHDKPEIGRLLDGYAKQVGVIGVGDTKTSAKFDFVSEYYINCSAWGLFILSWLQGLFFRSLEFVFRSVVSPLIAAMIVAVTIVENNDFFSLTMLWPSILKQFLVWSLILSLVCRKVKTRQPRRKAAVAASAVP